MQPLIIANWKSNKTKKEALDWIGQFKNNQKEFVLCPSFTLLDCLHTFISDNNLPIALGAQDISPFGPGASTGEVSGAQIKEFAEYALIGHSERRLLGETDSLLEKKVEQARSAGLKPVFFVQDRETKVPPNVEIIVHEPPDSISTVSGGVPQDPAMVETATGNLKKNYPRAQILYGASIDETNINNYTSLENIDGVVVGNKSLDATSFIKILQNV